MASSARIDELQKKFDENPRRYFAPLANEYRKAGELEQAIQICQEYLPQQPGHMSGHIVYGQALYELGRHEEAKAVFETALALDPENLIALKHLGDIARNAGDIKGARAWYQRVLEADPRNEEIAQIMLSLLSLPEGTPAIGIPVMPPHAEETGELDSVEPLDVAASTEPAQEPVRSATPLGTPMYEPAAPPPPPTPPASVPVADEPLAHEYAAAADDADDAADDSADDSELLDIEDFSMGASPTAAPSAAQVTETSEEFIIQTSATNDGAESLGVDTSLAAGFEAGAFEAPPRDLPVADIGLEPTGEADSASSANDAEPPIELADDINLGLIDDGSDAGGAADIALDGLQSFDEGVVAEEDEIVAAVPGLEAESFFDLPNEAMAPTPESAAERMPTPDAPATAASELPDLEPAEFELATPGKSAESAESDESAEPVSGQAFLTETMAELYLEQGHLESALIIYRTLVEQRPDDEHLRDRMRLIEDRAYGRSEEYEPPVASRATPARGTSANRPTIREFLGQLMANGQAIAFPSNWSTTPLASAPVPEGTHIESPAAKNGAPPTAAPPAPTAPPTMPSDTVSGSIDALFTGANAARGGSAGDVEAARAIAGAFAPDAEDATAEPEPIRGAPTHRATDELSLDHVFKSNAAPRSTEGGAGFSFSQFFAEESKPGQQSRTTRDAPAAAPVESTDDIAQFNAWLDGLKKKA
jgi:tetratricopeptide (TPR) repeat protein